MPGAALSLWSIVHSSSCGLAGASVEEQATARQNDVGQGGCWGNARRRPVHHGYAPSGSLPWPVKWPLILISYVRAVPSRTAPSPINAPWVTVHAVVAWSSKLALPAAPYSDRPALKLSTPL
ncbi:hypothetical protein CDD83_10774 [Cordyceps sp. RAO-2017]|nr:hypothetical protein CDD83_10774 [Cordyceps sp. RAO-2017]